MITLQFLRGTGWDSKLIEWFGHGAQFSHVDSILPDGSLLGSRSDVVMGVPEGVQIRPAAYVGQQKTLKIELPSTPEQEAEYYLFLNDQLGKPYDKRGIISFITGRNWQTPDAWFCSELVGTGLVRCGWFPHPLTTPTNKLDPAGLILAISAETNVNLS